MSFYEAALPQPGALGFTVHYENTHTVVAHIKPTGQAETCGIRPGSAVTHVNGVDVANMTHEERISLMRTPNRPLCMRFAASGTWDGPDGLAAAEAAVATGAPEAQAEKAEDEDEDDSAAIIVAAPAVIAAPVKMVQVFLYDETMGFEDLIKGTGISSYSATTPAYLPEYRLTFTRKAYDGVEPAYANIEPRMGAAVPVHGGVRSIAEADLEKVDKYVEGQLWCKRVKVACCNYADEESEDETFTLVANTANTCAPSPPSVRHAKLLSKYSGKLGLKDEYIAMLNAQDTLDTTNMRAPSSSVTATLTSVELKEHSVGADTVFVAMADLVFDVTAQVGERQLLARMAGGSGTRLALQMWLAACGDGTQKVSEVLKNMTQEQQGYVNAWAQHLSSNFECVGRLMATDESFAEDDWDEGGEDEDDKDENGKSLTGMETIGEKDAAWGNIQADDDWLGDDWDDGMDYDIM